MTERYEFNATAIRSGEWWAVEIHDLPRGCAGFTQGSTPEEAHSMAVEAVSLLLDVPESDVTVNLTLRGESGEVVGT
jgi:predicted RNase H-like HicB family nuclease